MKRQNVAFLRWFCFLTAGIIILIIMTGNVSAADFSAKVKIKLGEELSEGDIFVSGQKYCLELVQYGEKGKIIVDSEKNDTTIILYSDKEYMTISSDDMISLMNNPFQSYQYTLAQGEEVSMGSETLQGYECEVYQIIISDTPIMSKWQAKNLDFPIKIVQHGEPERTIEITDIEEKAVDPLIFAIPESFTKWIDPASLPGEPPEWTADMEASPLMTPPFEEKMAPGDIVRIKVESGKSLAVKAEGISESGALARVIPFKGSNPLKDEDQFNNFAKKEVICTRNHEMSGEADELVIRVYEGNITLVAKWMDMFEKEASVGEEIRYPISGKEYITTRFINLTAETAEATFAYYQNGEPMVEDIPLNFRTITLRNPWDVDNPTWVAQGDELVIKVNTGKMQVKLGQFDSFEF
jgi:hypothetical protein